MPFKVVQTIEKSKICISAVPSGWEKNGTLWWPPKSQTGSICDEKSIPKENWKSYSCVVKRQYSTYIDASEEAKKMEAHTDTEEENTSTGIHGNAIPLFGNFNSMIVHNDYQQQPSPPVGPQVGDTISLNNCNLDSSFLLRNNNDYSADLIQNQKIIIDLLEKQAENTKRILTQLAKHEACFGEIYNKITPISNINLNNVVIEKFPPVKTVDELKKLEENLEDANFEAKYISSMSQLCSEGSNLKGLTLSYKLIDYFISRELMLQCSWTGNTRNNSENEKIAFKFFERIRHVFFATIHNGDPKFSKVECDQFFKRILKKSKQRLFSTVKPQTHSTPNNKISLKRKIRSSAEKSSIVTKNNPLRINEEPLAWPHNAANTSPANHDILPAYLSPGNEGEQPVNLSQGDEAAIPANPCKPAVEKFKLSNEDSATEGQVTHEPQITEETTETESAQEKLNDAIMLLLKSTEKKRKCRKT